MEDNCPVGVQDVVRIPVAALAQVAAEHVHRHAEIVVVPRRLANFLCVLHAQSAVECSPIGVRHLQVQFHFFQGLAAAAGLTSRDFPRSGANSSRGQANRRSACAAKNQRMGRRPRVSRRVSGSTRACDGRPSSGDPTLRKACPARGPPSLEHPLQPRRL
eukprot:CAMPEP_0117505324 /NCGR_PEP_ID=MMETSP0784-20121206/25318_1 /TAXON_ID=39447 /ORGANISM="" /LENGTH=159 /DNA_ID=CAMNT_0005300731 /DNA_START=267 /DNA_END=746 /DNA_ORIENTATION=+